MANRPGLQWAIFSFRLCGWHLACVGFPDKLHVWSSTLMMPMLVLMFTLRIVVKIVVSKQLIKYHLNPQMNPLLLLHNWIVVFSFPCYGFLHLNHPVNCCIVPSFLQFMPSDPNMSIIFNLYGSSIRATQVNYSPWERRYLMKMHKFH